MAKFAKSSPVKQTLSVIKIMQKSISSVGTVANYEERLLQIAINLKNTNQGELRDLTPESAISYLQIRSEEVGQKTLDMERQAIQSMMKKVTGKLNDKETLAVIKSDHKQILKSRSYTKEQAKLVGNSQTERIRLSTQLAHICGLRAHELLTIARVGERPMSERPALNTKFSGRDGEIYTVIGKGGLIREIIIPKELTKKLEYNRLDQPQKIVDRGINYNQKYNISGGQRWSNSFSSASKRALNWSGGGHGLRHSYAQERMNELHFLGNNYIESLEIVSQEMGHFRPGITEIYLR